MAAAPRPLIREAPARSKSCQDRHQAYLQLLQERNRSLRQLKSQDRSRKAELEERERGFSTHFSGANATRTRRKASQSSLSSLEAVGQSSGQGVGVSKQWEVNTVEIKGEDGEVFAVRPGLDLRPLPESDTLEDTGPASWDNTMEATLKMKASVLGMSQQTQGSLADDCKDLAAELEALQRVNDWENSDGSEEEADGKDRDVAESQVPEEVGELLKATLTGTREELQDLREALVAEGIVAKDEAAAPEADPPCTSPGEVGQRDELADESEQGSSGKQTSPKSSTAGAGADAPGAAAAAAASTMGADAIAQRIAKLDDSWRGALLQLLDEAEAAAVAKAAPKALAATGSLAHADPTD